MTKKLFRSIETTLSMQEAIRDLLGEMGQSQARDIARVAIERGVFDGEVLAGFELQGAAEFVRKALKAKQADGLAFAKPVGDEGEWKQRVLWTYEDAEKSLLQDASGIEADYAELMREHAWCLNRYGKAPVLPELRFASESEAA